MTPENEQYLLDRVPLSGGTYRQPSVRDAIDQMVRDGMIASPKQAWRTLEKWCRQGRYEFGVTIDLGWRIPESN